MKPFLAILAILASMVICDLQKWIVSLHSEATENDLKRVSAWIESRDYKISETINDHQLRAIFVNADKRIGKIDLNLLEELEKDSELKHLIDTIEVEDDHYEL